MTSSTSCLQSIRLVRGSGEKAADTSVSPAYASSGQKNRGTSTRSRRTTTSASQHVTATVSRICAAAIENCSAPATPYSAMVPASSSRSSRIGCDASSAMASALLMRNSR
ncbi:MAG: hypothetical protein DMF97_14145 [Acidobacteria bacterium]|nr:MAG: hypothetical protein DMF97_14145 [Acidobacteriota bacterium]